MFREELQVDPSIAAVHNAPVAGAVPTVEDARPSIRTVRITLCLHRLRLRAIWGRADFFRLRRLSSEHAEELIAEFRQKEDHGLRCWLLELIGKARSPLELPVLVEQLQNPDDESLMFLGSEKPRRARHKRSAARVVEGPR
jgi:hypothetical protein